MPDSFINVSGTHRIDGKASRNKRISSIPNWRDQGMRDVYRRNSRVKSRNEAPFESLEKGKGNRRARYEQSESFLRRNDNLLVKVEGSKERHAHRDSFVIPSSASLAVKAGRDIQLKIGMARMDRGHGEGGKKSGVMMSISGARQASTTISSTDTMDLSDESIFSLMTHVPAPKQPPPAPPPPPPSKECPPYPTENKDLLGTWCRVELMKNNCRETLQLPLDTETESLISNCLEKLKRHQNSPNKTKKEKTKAEEHSEEKKKRKKRRKQKNLKKDEVKKENESNKKKGAILEMLAYLFSWLFCLCHKRIPPKDSPSSKVIPLESQSLGTASLDRDRGKSNSHFSQSHSAELDKFLKTRAKVN